MNFKKIISVVLLCVAIYQTNLTTVTSKSSTSNIHLTKVSAGSKIYQYNKFGLVNSATETFADTGMVIIEISGNKYTAKNSQIYKLSESGGDFLGYVEYEYKTSQTQFEAAALINNEGLWPTPAQLFYDSYGIASFLQSYATINGGYLVPLGINHAGQQNGKNSDGTINFTLYEKIHGDLIKK
jgi:hypothetical protein